jgi:CRP/FNR family transcriptional regulator, nitrogen fixation regulation protein
LFETTQTAPSNLNRARQANSPIKMPSGAGSNISTVRKYSEKRSLRTTCTGVREGAVRTHKLLSDGRRQIGAFHIPGDIFGIEIGEHHRFTAEAILDTAVWIAKRQSLFSGLAKGDIPTANKARDLITRSLEHAENHLLLLGRQRSLEKVAAFLAEMDRRSGRPAVLLLPMTRRDIADYLGLTIETVSRALSELRNQRVIGFIGQTQREVVLHDRRKLDQLAN